MSDLDINSLFEKSIDDLADLPVFRSKPAGSYVARFEYEQDETAEGNPFLKFTFDLQEVIELVDAKRIEELDFAGDKLPKVVFTAFPFKKDGDASAFGEGLIKLVIAGLKEINPGSNVKEILDNNNGATVAITLKEKKQKDKDTKEIKEVNELVALTAAA